MLVKNKNIKYVAFYNDHEINKVENRNSNLAVTNKVNYVCSALNRCGYNVDIVSPCWTENKTGYFKGNFFTISDKITLKYFATFGSRNILSKKFKQIFSALQLLLFLIFNTKKNEQVIVYHSLGLMPVINIVKLVKQLNVLLEVEEVYTNVWEKKTSTKEELKYINKMQKYILVSDVLKEMFPDKPSVVLYGSYTVVDTSCYDKKNSENVDVVYAGSIDTLKGGAMNAVLSTKYLPENYFMHILGFGSQSAVDKLNHEVNKLNEQAGRKRCIYHGVMVGDDYKKFLSSCHIGVNPQNEGDYMNTAFPSKVLSYLSHNLKVVSTRINSIEISQIAEHITFSENDEPQNIAKAIMSSANNNDINHGNIVEKLDNKFVQELKNLIET